MKFLTTRSKLPQGITEDSFALAAAARRHARKAASKPCRRVGAVNSHNDYSKVLTAPQTGRQLQGKFRWLPDRKCGCARMAAKVRSGVDPEIN